MQPLDTSNIRLPYALRRVPHEAMAKIVPISSDIRAGDVAVGRVKKVGKNTRIELANGRQATLYTDDLVAVVFGNRYATAQFEGYVGLEGTGCDLLSMGGLCGLVASKASSIADPTKLEILGRIANAAGEPLRLEMFSAYPPSRQPAIPYVSSVVTNGKSTPAHDGLWTFQRDPGDETDARTSFAMADKIRVDSGAVGSTDRANPRPKTVVVCGSSMDSGKSFTARSIIKGLQSSGSRVAGIKLTGTAAGRDTWSFADAGATPALDFVDGGWASTYLCGLQELLSLHSDLIRCATEDGAEIVVIEVADGILQRETAALLQCSDFVRQVDHWVFATGDPLAAYAGVDVLSQWGIKPLAISGLISTRPLAMIEAQAATAIEVVTAEQLQNGWLNSFLEESLSETELVNALRTA